MDPYLGLSTIELDVYENPDRALEILEKGIKKHPKDLSMLNNYAYCLIMKGYLQKARTITDNTNFRDSVHMTATKGYLLIKEGNIDEGRKQYNRAASLAGKNRNLQALVHQKKQLELCKYYIMIGNRREAMKRIHKGLKYKTSEKYFSSKLEQLKNDLSI